jgi:pimeloyl-ACP methyl ester carboxylesterase
VSAWRDFPARVTQATGCAGLVYSRYGNGQSETLREPHGVDYMHQEALEVLPELLQRFGIERPVLVGHSDGASIALIYAGACDQLRGAVVMAPHVVVEDLSIASIVEARQAFATTDLADRLARHHADAAATFHGWNDIWLDPAFRSWNIEEYVPRIQCPLLAIQGFDDQYGTMAQLEAIARGTGGPVELLQLADCRHSPHRDQPGRVIEAISRFVECLRGPDSAAHL